MLLKAIQGPRNIWRPSSRQEAAFSAGDKSSRGNDSSAIQSTTATTHPSPAAFVAAGARPPHATRRDGRRRYLRHGARRRVPPAPPLRSPAARSVRGGAPPDGPSSSGPAAPVGAAPGGGGGWGPAGHEGDAGQGGVGAQGGAVHEGDQGLPAVRLLPHRRADPALPRRALRDARRARQRGAPAGPQGVLQLAHLPAALHRRRVLRRLRHHPRSIQEWRTAGDARESNVFLVDCIIQ